MDYKGALEILDALPNWEKRGAGEFGLARLSYFLAQSGIRVPYDSLEVVGSKGKGTIASGVAFVLSFRKRVGLFTSPHLCSVRERIAVLKDGKMLCITKDEFARHLDSLAQIKGFKKLTYFEALFAIALSWFYEQGVSFAVFEAGLGGRLDATNAIAHRFAAITPLELEHTDILGPTIESIAKEKTAVVGKETEAVFCLQKGRWLQHMVSGLVKRRMPSCRITCVSAAQMHNAAIEIANHISRALECGPLIKTAADIPPLPGRQEVVAVSGRRIVMDVCHTKASVAALVSFLRTHGVIRPSIVCAYAKDKDVVGIVSVLQKLKAERLVYINMQDERMLSGKAFLDRCAVLNRWPVYIADSGFLLKKGFERFSTDMVFIGSFRLIGLLKRELRWGRIYAID